MKKSEIIFGLIRLPLDYLAALTAFLLAYFLRPITDLIPGVQFQFLPEQLPPWEDYIRLALIASGFLLLFFMVNGLYSLKITRRFREELFKIVFLVSAWLMFIIAYYFLIVHQLFFSRIALAHIWFFTLGFVLTGRFLVRVIQSLMLRFGVGRRRVLLIGADELAERFYKTLQKDKRYHILGALTPHMPSKTVSLPLLGSLTDLQRIIRDCAVEEIIQSDPHLKEAEAANLLSFCRSHQIHYHFIPDLIRLQRTNVETEMIGSLPLITLKQTPLEGWGWVYKRLFDLSFSFLFIILLIPFWIFIPLAIKLDSRGPVIYKSRRKYRHKTFMIYKFRSMSQDADQKRADLLGHNERKGPLFKIKDDPRVTRLGRFLRKTSLDELPQLFNVFAGDLSLVGPRPHMPEEVEKYEAHHFEVFALKPGLTGLAQVSGRSHLDFEEEVRLDLYYIENWSLWLDLKILWKSAGVVFRGDGC